MRLFITLNLLLVFLSSTFAYLDPGSGSYIIQMIVAAALGGAYTIKLYWYKIKSIFTGSSNSDLEEDDNP